MITNDKDIHASFEPTIPQDETYKRNNPSLPQSNLSTKNFLIEAKILYKYLPLLRELVSAKSQSKQSISYTTNHNLEGKNLTGTHLEGYWSSWDGERMLRFKLPVQQADTKNHETVNQPATTDYTLQSDSIQSSSITYNNISSTAIQFNGNLLTDIIRSGGTNDNWLFSFNNTSLNKTNIKQKTATSIDETKHINSNDHTEKVVTLSKQNLTVDFTLMSEEQYNHPFEKKTHTSLDVTAEETEDKNTSISHSIPPKILQKGIKAVQFAIGDTENMPILNGILFTIKKQTISNNVSSDDIAADSTVLEQMELDLLTTDGYRIANYTFAPTDIEHTKQNNSAAENIVKKAVISNKTCSLLLHLLDFCNTNIQITYGDNYVQFKGFTEDGIEYLLESSLLAGNFPECKNFLTSTANMCCSCNADNLLTAIKQASIMAKDNQIVQLFFEQTQITVKSANVHLGKSEIKVPANLTQTYPSNDHDQTSQTQLTININLKLNFLLQILQIFGKYEIKILLDHNKPVLFSSDTMPQAVFLMLPIYNMH